MADFIGDINIMPAEILSRDESNAQVRLASGETRRASLPPGDIPDGAANVAIRPEHVVLRTGGGPAAMHGTLANIVYFGAGTHYHVRMDDGAAIVVEVQNRIGVDHAPSAGDRVGVEFPDGTLQLLCD